MLRNQLRPALHDSLINIRNIGSLVYEISQIEENTFLKKDILPQTLLIYNGAATFLNNEQPNAALQHLVDFFDQFPMEEIYYEESRMLLETLRKIKAYTPDITDTSFIVGRYQVIKKIIFVDWEGDERVFGYQLYDKVVDAKVAVSVGRMLELVAQHGCEDVALVRNDNGRFTLSFIAEIDVEYIREADIRQLVHDALFEKDTYYAYDIATLLRTGALKRLYLSIK